MSTRVMAEKAESTIQGARVRFFVPWLSSSPQLGVGTGRPKPRKSSAVSEPIAPATVKGMKVTRVAAVFGRM